jgi:hypothetical protein
MGRVEAIGRQEAASGRDFTRKMARHLQPSVPAWDQAGPALPWWETVPQASRRVILDISVSQSEDTTMTSFSPQSEIGAGERGWTPMKRILLALGTLAALFAVAGATAKW